MKAICILTLTVVLAGCSIHAPTYTYVDGNTHYYVTEPTAKPPAKPVQPKFPLPEKRYKRLLACVKENVSLLGKPNPRMYIDGGRFVEYTRALDAYIDILSIKLGNIAKECL